VDGRSFEFVVEQAFAITGRGVGVLGAWRSGSITSGTPGCLFLDTGAVVRVHRIDVDYARVSGGERVALVLHGVTIEQVPAGSILRARQA
jgi:selenocysteine-specific translation elongation factor